MQGNWGWAFMDSWDGTWCKKVSAAASHAKQSLCSGCTVTHPLQPQTWPGTGTEIRSSLQASTCPVHLHRSIRASQKGFDCKGISCACLLFPIPWWDAAAPSSAVNQSLIYHPQLNVSCCLGLLSRVAICF